MKINTWGPPQEGRVYGMNPFDQPQGLGFPLIHPENQISQRVQMATMIRSTFSQNAPATAAGRRALRNTEKVLDASVQALIDLFSTSQSATAALAVPNGKASRSRKAAPVTED